MAGVASIWTPYNKERLITLVKEGKQVEELADIFGVTTTAIEIKCGRLGVKILRYNRSWTKEEEQYFSELWCNTNKSMKYIMKKLYRNENGLKIKAQKMKLGPRTGDGTSLSLSEVASEMGISLDRVRNWIRLGLKCRNKRVGRIKTAVDVEDLLRFIVDHQNIFDASLISDWLFAEEPDWLMDKRLRDINKETREYTEYSLWEDNMERQLITMVKQGINIDNIANKLGKTRGATMNRARALGLAYKSSYHWSTQEIKHLRLNSEYSTVSDLSKVLKRRSIKSIQWKCEQHNFQYHISEKCVNKSISGGTTSND